MSNKPIRLSNLKPEPPSPRYLDTTTALTSQHPNISSKASPRANTQPVSNNTYSSLDERTILQNIPKGLALISNFILVPDQLISSLKQQLHNSKITIENIQQIITFHYLITNSDKSLLDGIQLIVTGSIPEVLNYLHFNQSILNNIKGLTLKDSLPYSNKLEIPTISVQEINIDMCLCDTLTIHYQNTLKKITVNQQKKSIGIQMTYNALPVFDISADTLKVIIDLKQLAITSSNSLSIKNLNLDNIKAIEQLTIQASEIKMDLSQTHHLDNDKITIKSSNRIINEPPLFKNQNTNERSISPISKSNKRNYDNNIKIECLGDLFIFQECIQENIISFSEIKKIEVGINKELVIYNDNGSMKEEYQNQEEELITTFLEFLALNNINAFLHEDKSYILNSDSNNILTTNQQQPSSAFISLHISLEGAISFVIILLALVILYRS